MVNTKVNSSIAPQSGCSFANKKKTITKVHLSIYQFDDKRLIFTNADFTKLFFTLTPKVLYSKP